MGGKAIGGSSMSTDMKKKFEAARASGNMDQAKALADKAQKFNDDKKAEKAKAKEAKTIAKTDDQKIAGKEISVPPGAEADKINKAMEKRGSGFREQFIKGTWKEKSKGVNNVLDAYESGSPLNTYSNIGVGKIEKINPPSKKYVHGSVRVRNSQGESDTFDLIVLANRTAKGGR